MKLKKITNKIFQVNFRSQLDLAETFLRFQEHYECPNSTFRERPFTLGEYRQWYTRKFGTFSYYEDWPGFNIYSHIFQPFLEGLFDPLTTKEQQLLKLVKNLEEPFCIIGTYGKAKDSLLHETLHGMYFTNLKYRKHVDKVLKKYKLTNVRKWLKLHGYCNKEFVLRDECQAYIGADFEWLRDNENVKISEKLYKELNKLRNRYYKY